MLHPHLPAFDPTNVFAWQETLYSPSLTPPPSSAPKGLFLASPTTPPTYHRLNPSTEALILISPYVGLPRIETDNLAEWLVRLSSLHDIGFFTEFSPTPDGPAPLRLSHPPLLLRHLHLSFPTAPLWTPSTFDQMIRYHRLALAYDALPELPWPTPPTSPFRSPPPPS